MFNSTENLLNAYYTIIYGGNNRRNQTAKDRMAYVPHMIKRFYNFPFISQIKINQNYLLDRVEYGFNSLK